MNKQTFNYVCSQNTDEMYFYNKKNIDECTEMILVKKLKKSQKKLLINYYDLKYAVSKIVNNCDCCIYLYKSSSCIKNDCERSMIKYFLREGEKMYNNKSKI